METRLDQQAVVTGTPSLGAVDASAVSWGAIIGGAVAAAAMSLILFILGTGLGLTSVSPFSREGLDAETFGIAAIGWITFTSLASAALGGYLAGRLRVRWLDVPRDEVFFRDTAHGFLAWGLATLLTAALFASAATSLVGAGARAGVSVAQGAGELAGAAAGGLAATWGGRQRDL